MYSHRDEVEWRNIEKIMICLVEAEDLLDKESYDIEEYVYPSDLEISKLSQRYLFKQLHFWDSKYQRNMIKNMITTRNQNRTIDIYNDVDYAYSSLHDYIKI